MRFAERLVAPVVDGLLVAAGLWLLPLVREVFCAPHWAGAILVVLAYSALCAGMWLLKLIERRPGSGTVQPAENSDGCIGFLSFAFAVFAMGMVFQALSVGLNGAAGQAMERLPDDHPVLFMAMCILMLVWAGLFPAATLSRLKPRLAAGSLAALAARLAGTLAVNAMVLLSAAWWQAALGGSEPTGASTGLRILLFAVFYVVFLLFYAPPRLALLALDGDKLSLATFLIALSFFVWPLTV